MTKKIIWGLMGIIFMLLCFSCNQTSTYAPDRHQYNPENKIVLSKDIYAKDSMSAISPAPEEFRLHQAVYLSDVILTGQITDIESEIVYLCPSDTDTPEDYPFYERMIFHLQVRDVLLGECSKKEISFLIIGDNNSYCTKPKINDELILMLKDWSIYDGYYRLSTETEESMFAINPPEDGLYSFSNNISTSAFDGKNPRELLTYIKEVMPSFVAQMETENAPYIKIVGKIGNEYLSDDNPRKKTAIDYTEIENEAKEQQNSFGVVQKIEDSMS